MIAPTSAVPAAAQSTALNAQLAARGARPAGFRCGVRFVMPVLFDPQLLKSFVFTPAQRAALTLACPSGRLARRMPAVDVAMPITVDAAALWVMLAYHFSPREVDRAIPTAQRMEGIFRAVYGPELRAEHWTRIVMVEDAVRSLVEISPAAASPVVKLPRVGDRKPW